MDTFTDVSDHFRWFAGRHVRSHCVGDDLHYRDVTFQGKASALPISFAEDIIKYLFESEGFEPTRGPWGHVSQPVVSVDHHWLSSIENLSCVLVEGLERNVDRSRYVPIQVFGLGKDIDELHVPGVDQLE